MPLYPRGPRSGPSYSVSVHQRLIDPIRPTRGHIGTSPPGGLYPMPSLCHDTPWPRQPASGSVLSLSILCQHVVLFDPGKSIGCTHPVPSPTARAFDYLRESRHFHRPHACASCGGHLTRLHYGSLSLRPADLLAPLAQLTDTVTKADNPLSFTFLGGNPSLVFGQRGLLLPGFQRFGRPCRCRI